MSVEITDETMVNSCGKYVLGLHDSDDKMMRLNHYDGVFYVYYIAFIFRICLGNAFTYIKYSNTFYGAYIIFKKWILSLFRPV